jgi:L-lactate dehydrogenase (cytochrome)
VQHAEARGIKGLFITVDAPLLGRREKVGSLILWIQFTRAFSQDMRMKFDAEDPAEVSKAGSEAVDRSQGAARAISVSPTSSR